MSSLLDSGLEGEIDGVCNASLNESGDLVCLHDQNGKNQNGDNLNDFGITEEAIRTFNKNKLMDTSPSNLIYDNDTDTATDLMWQTWFAEYDNQNLLIELKNAETFTIEKTVENKTDAAKNIFFRLLFLVGLTESKLMEIRDEMMRKMKLRLEGIRMENLLLEKNPEILKAGEHSLIFEAVNKFYGKTSNISRLKNEEEVEIKEIEIKTDLTVIYDIESNYKRNIHHICKAATSYYFPAAESVAAHIETELSDGRAGLKILHEMIFFWRDMEGIYYSPPNNSRKGYYSSRHNEGNVDGMKEKEKRKAEDDFYHEFPGEKKEARYQRKLAEAVGGELD